MPASAKALLDDYGNLPWPMSDVFSDDSFGVHKATDPRLCKQPPGEVVNDHIRLVRISLVRSDGLICCETYISRLDTPEQYAALSYTWGSPLAQCPILLDGRRHLVPRGLWRFLERAGELDKELPKHRWLWIDALSIDQRSPHERAYQVSIMASIFWKAKQVIVWLGPAYGNSTEAMEALRASEPHSPHVGRRSSKWTSPAESAFVGLCERPYWRRLWVFQELSAGREIHLMCGSEIVSCGVVHSDLWQLFSDFVSGDDTRARLPLREGAAKAVRCSPAWDMIKQIALCNINRVHNRVQTTLWTFLTSTRNFRCTDAHDRVYALLSISTSGHQGIRADYTVPVQLLLNRVLRNWHSYLRPSSLDEVSRQCILLEDMFSLDRNSIYGLSSPDTCGTGSLLDYPRTFELKPKDYMYAKTWAEFYGHEQVCRLLRGSDQSKRSSLRTTPS